MLYSKVPALITQKNYSARGVGHRGDAGPPNVNLDPPNISETTRARTLKLKTPLDMVKYSLWVHFLARGRPGSAGPLRQLLVSDKNVFRTTKITLQCTHTLNRREKKKIFRQYIN